MQLHFKSNYVGFFSISISKAKHDSSRMEP